MVSCEGDGRVCGLTGAERSGCLAGEVGILSKGSSELGLAGSALICLLLGKIGLGVLSC